MRQRPPTEAMALFPVVVALSVLELLDWHTVVVVARLSATTRLEFEPLVLAWLKKLVWKASGLLGHDEVRVHPTSLFENLWKLWRRGVVVLESRLITAATSYGGVFWQLETSVARLCRRGKQGRSPGRQPPGGLPGPCCCLGLGRALEPHALSGAPRLRSDGCLGADRVQWVPGLRRTAAAQNFSARSAQNSCCRGRGQRSRLRGRGTCEHFVT